MKILILVFYSTIAWGDPGLTRPAPPPPQPSSMGSSWGSLSSEIEATWRDVQSIGTPQNACSFSQDVPSVLNLSHPHPKLPIPPPPERIAWPQRESLVIHSGPCHAHEIDAKEKQKELRNQLQPRGANALEDRLLSEIIRTHSSDVQVCISNYSALLDLTLELCNTSSSCDLERVLKIFQMGAGNFTKWAEGGKDLPIEISLAQDDFVQAEMNHGKLFMAISQQTLGTGGFKRVEALSGFEMKEGQLHHFPAVAYLPNIDNRVLWNKEVTREMAVYRLIAQFREAHPSDLLEGISWATLSADGEKIYAPRFQNDLFAGYSNKKNVQSNEKAKSFLKQILSGLHLLHGLRISHGDIKEENFLIKDDRKLVLSDFGLHQSEREPFEPHGTPGYMAPEVLHSFVEPHSTPDIFKADIYSLGIVALHFLPHYTSKGSYPWSLNDNGIGHKDAPDCSTSEPDFVSYVNGDKSEAQRNMAIEYINCIKQNSRILYQDVFKDKENSCKISPKSFKCKILTLAEACLRFNPQARPDIEQLQRSFNSE